MASFKFIFLILIPFVFLRSSLAATNSAAASDTQKACNATRYPNLCVSSLTKPPQNPPKTSLDIIKLAISVSITNVPEAQKMAETILANARNNPNKTIAAKNSLELLNNSQFRLSATNNALVAGKIKSARIYLSSALMYHYECWSIFKNINETQTVSFLDTLVNYTSNALSMVRNYDIYGKDINLWTPPKTERDGFWEPFQKGGRSDVRIKFPSNLRADATVCKDGSNGCYKTVQEAVNAAPNNQPSKKFVIYIKAGTYDEIVRVPLEKKNVVFLGDGMGKSIITGNLTVGPPGISTYNTATVGVLGDGFMASGITFQNTAGAPTRQAVAFRSDSDQQYIENCEFIGRQDTLYARGLRQYYKSCTIEGNVDFIFGNAAAIFEGCKILVNPRLEDPTKGEQNTVTANSRSDPAQSTGFVFQNCSVNGTEEYMKLYNSNPSVHKNYLGRPWKDYSRAVFMNSLLEVLITPQGWSPWSGNQSLDTLYFGEFQNSGAGSNLSLREKWSSSIPAQQIQTYSIQNFIQGNEWLPTS